MKFLWLKIALFGFLHYPFLLFHYNGSVSFINIYSQFKPHEKIYHQDFDSEKSLNGFRFASADQWQWGEDEDGNGYLHLTGPNDYTPPVRSPHSIAVLDTYLLEDFILEVDLLQIPVQHECKGDDCIICQHRDLCIFWNIQDSTHFNYAHIAAHTDNVSHQVHVVNDAPRTAITSNRSYGVQWGDNKWNRVKLTHQNGRTSIYFNDMKTPVLQAEGETFKEGYIGFGSFDEMGKIDNIRLYAKDYKQIPVPIFETKNNE